MERREVVLYEGQETTTRSPEIDTPIEGEGHIASSIFEIQPPLNLEEQEKIQLYIAELRGMVQAPELVVPTQVLAIKEPISDNLFSDDEHQGQIDAASTWNGEFQRYMRRRKQQAFEGVFKESMATKDANMQRHLFLSDFQIPDHNRDSIKAVSKFIKDFRPDTLHLVGDMLNFTKAGSYSVEGGYEVSLGDEIRIGREIINKLVDHTRKHSPDARVIWYEGNHEYRLQRYLARNAEALTDITDDDGERVMTLPHLFDMKAKGIEWVPYYETHREGGNTEVEHGDVARSKAGHTAHAMLDRRGRSGLSGHTHRLAMVTRNQGGDTKYWIETGSLCNPEPTPRWAKKPDWVNGFAVGIYDKKEDIMHPMPVLIQKNQFAFGGKIYKP